MPGPLMIAISLALLAGSGHALAQTNPGTAAAAKADRPFNVGFVLYTRGKAPGTLDARWNYGNAYSGRGKATGGPASGGFAGRYHVRYFLETGEFSDEYDLDIEKHGGGGFYDVTWIETARSARRASAWRSPSKADWPSAGAGSPTKPD